VAEPRHLSVAPGPHHRREASIDVHDDSSQVLHPLQLTLHAHESHPIRRKLRSTRKQKEESRFMNELHYLAVGKRKCLHGK
jgi:hypothetical protein